MQSRAPLPPGAPPAAGSRLAVVHDWCPAFRGGERVLAELCSAFGARHVYTLVARLDDAVTREYFPAVSFHTSPADRLPWVERYYRWLFVVAPFLIEQFDVTAYDAVVSSSAAFARGVLARADQPHLCYVHSPARYAWDEQFTYLDQAGLGFGPRGLLVRYALHRLRAWDVQTAHRPDLMVANSTLVRQRIARTYGRDADVVFPPLALDELPYAADKDDYYVTASFLAPYKRADLVVRAFADMPRRRLMVIGDGPQRAALRRLAGANVTFTGFVPRAEYVALLGRARAMVFAGCEDFGIALAEAQACGTPLIALGRGGARDIVRPLGAHADPTGLLFPLQSAAAVAEAVARFETAADRIRPASCRDNAQRFAADRFRREMQEALAKTFAIHARGPR